MFMPALTLHIIFTYEIDIVTKFCRDLLSSKPDS